MTMQFATLLLLHVASLGILVWMLVSRPVSHPTNAGPAPMIEIVKPAAKPKPKAKTAKRPAKATPCSKRR
jgi:hypothetical protein